MKVLKTYVLFVSLLMTCFAQASVIGMLYSGPETNVSFGLQKTNDGEIYFLLDIDNNPKKTEYVFSPGNPFNPTSVVIVDGKPLIHLSIFNGSEHGFDNSKKVRLLEGSNTSRTSQRSMLSNDFQAMAEYGMLVDKSGKKYKLEELKGVMFIYQVAGERDTSLAYQILEFESLKNGETKQLLGDIKLGLPIP